MKINSIELDRLHNAIARFDTLEMRGRYMRGEFPRADKTKDLGKRYRWDLFWLARDSGFEFSEPDKFTDDHIDTALRKIVGVFPEIRHDDEDAWWQAIR
jgi:hypothetical protein